MFDIQGGGYSGWSTFWLSVREAAIYKRWKAWVTINYWLHCDMKCRIMATFSPSHFTGTLGQTNHRDMDNLIQFGMNTFGTRFP